MVRGFSIFLRQPAALNNKHASITQKAQIKYPLMKTATGT
jgi:hypothetical protein